MVAWRLKRLSASVWMDLLLWSLWILVLFFTIILPIYLGAHFIGTRDCHPSLRLEVEPATLKGFISPDPQPASGVAEDGIAAVDVYAAADIPTEEEDNVVTKVFLALLPPEIGVEIGNSTHRVARLPRGLYKRGTIMLEKEMEDYSIKDVAQFCSVNEIKEKGVISLGLAVCKDTIGEDGLEDIRSWVKALEDGVEDRLVLAAVQGELDKILELVPELFPKAGLNRSHVESIKDIIRPFETTELLNLVTAFSKANLTDSDLKVLSVVMSESAGSLHNVSRVLDKINPENLVPITENLDELGIKLSDFISNPGILLNFFGDPEKSALLVKLQGLLPRFRPTDIEAFLVFSQSLEQIQKAHGDPEDMPVMSKLFSIPLDVLLGAMQKLKLDSEAQLGMAGLQLMLEDDSFKVLQQAATDLQLLDAAARQRLIEDCTRHKLAIHCKNDRKDMCPGGQVMLGLACLLPLMFPGLIYAFSTILHYRGSLLQCGIGKPFNLPKTKIDSFSAWVILLPAYLVIMVPWTLCLVIYRQSKVWFGLADEAKGKGQPLEADSQHFHNASSFGLLLGAGQGVLHLGVQAVILGVVLLAGDVLLGLDKDFYVSSTLTVTTISLLLVCLTLAVSHLSSQESCRLSVDLATPPRSRVYLLSSLAWLVILVLVTIASTLILSLLVYIDTVGFSVWRWSALSLLLLLPLPVIQCVIYQLCVRTGAEQRFAWGLMASMIPVRFLDMERRRAQLFLVLSQSAWLMTHVTAWLVYAVFVQVTEGSDVVWRAWIPVILPALLIPPLVAALHWSASLSDLYSSAHVHPDMESEQKRRLSFPPDWRQLSGSSLSSESLAQAGFFYSCRRLKSCEATCYSCGRQIVEWTARTAEEAHKSVTDSCPLYTDVKTRHQSEEDDAGVTSSCVPEFIFLSITILFRLASVLLFIWVFWDSWVRISPALPSLVLIPLLFLVIFCLINPTIYYNTVLKNTSLLWTVLSPLVPQPKSSIKYIVLNLAVNTLLHFLLWCAMLGTSNVVFLLAWIRLRNIWPALLTLAVLSGLTVVPYWYLSLKPAREHQHSSAAARSNSKSVYVVSTSL